MSILACMCMSVAGHPAYQLYYIFQRVTEAQATAVDLYIQSFTEIPFSLSAYLNIRTIAAVETVRGHSLFLGLARALYGSARALSSVGLMYQSRKDIDGVLQLLVGVGRARPGWSFT